MVVTSVTRGAANHCHIGLIANSVTIEAPWVTDMHSEFSPIDTNSLPQAVTEFRSNSCRYTHLDSHTSVDLQFSVHTQMMISTRLSKYTDKHTSRCVQ